MLAAIPGAEAQMAWIREVCAHGVRRPGTAAGAAVADWCAARLAELGCEVTRQPVRAPASHPADARLVAWSVDDPGRRLTLDGFTIPFTTPTTGLRRHLTRLGASDSAGTAVVHRVTMTDLPVVFLDEGALGRHDPAGTFTTDVHTLPFGPTLTKVVEPVLDAGGDAMVGIVDAPWVTDRYFVPYDGVLRPIPGIWLDRTRGAALDELLDAGPVEVELTTDVTTAESVGDNLVATLPGSGDGWVVVGSHHDAPWASAVEDGSGIAQVLAQAAAWAAVPEAERPHNLCFLLTAAHMSDGAGTQEFLRSWAHVDDIVVGIHLEHVAVRAEPDGAGGLRPTRQPEVRWWFTSESGALPATVTDAVTAEGLDRSLVLGPEALGPMPPTDGGFYHPAGIPVVSLLAAPMYLFDPLDTPAMVHEPSLVPTARATARIVAASRDLPGTDPTAGAHDE